MGPTGVVGDEWGRTTVTEKEDRGVERTLGALSRLWNRLSRDRGRCELSLGLFRVINNYLIYVFTYLFTCSVFIVILKIKIRGVSCILELLLIGKV